MEMLESVFSTIVAAIVVSVLGKIIAWFKKTDLIVLLGVAKASDLAAVRTDLDAVRADLDAIRNWIQQRPG